jgi:hypothetical protein
MEHPETTGAPEIAWLVWRAANGDGRAWERLVSQYEELVAAIHGAKLTDDDETLRELAVHGPKTGEPFRAAAGAQAGGNALSSVPPRWRQLLQSLSAEPSAQHLRQQGK